MKPTKGLSAYSKVQNAHFGILSPRKYCPLGEKSLFHQIWDQFKVVATKKTGNGKKQHFKDNPNPVGLRNFLTEWFIKVIPQKLNLPMNFFETFPEISLLSTVSKNTTKMIGHHSRLRDMMGQSYPIHAWTCGNHAHYSSVHVTFCGSSKHDLLK